MFISAAEPLAETVAGLLRRVEVLENMLVAKRAAAPAGRLRTRPDHCPFGTRCHPANRRKLVEDPIEQRAIAALIELRQDPHLSARDIARTLDQYGHHRRGGRKWSDPGSHMMVLRVLKRHGATTAEAARVWIEERNRAQRAGS